MASTMIFPASPEFSMQELVQKLIELYQAQGFSVMAFPLGNGASIDFRKSDGGFQKYIGLALGVKANIMIQGGNIVVNFTDAEWTGKIVAFAIGWIVCFIPVITAIIGSVRQANLPTNIGNDIQMFANGATPYGGAAGSPQQYTPYQQQYSPPQQAYQQPRQAPTSQATCQQCGAAIDENAQFCSSCGARTN